MSTLTEAEAEQLRQDLQEASSARYVVELRVALLSSGNWAIYTGLDPSQIEIVNFIDLFRLTDLARAELDDRNRAEELYEAKRQSLRTGAPETIVSTKNLEDMGL